MKSRYVAGGAIAVLAVVAAGSALTCAWTYHKVRGFDAKYGCDVLAGVPPKPAASPKPAATKEEKEQEEKSASTAVTNCVPRVEKMTARNEADGVFSIWVKTNEKPNTDEILRYIDITPSAGAVTATVRREEWWHWHPGYVIELRGTGFEYGRPYVVTVKSGLPFCGGGRLADDFVRVVPRPDESSEVRFADSGRYLPPVGDRVVAVDTVNVTGVTCLAHSVLPKNIVHLLSREEGEYKAYQWWSNAADDSSTAELALNPVKWSIPVRAERNRRAKVPVSLASAGVASNGVYLVAIRETRNSGGEGGWRYRLVCVSDIGISVRHEGGALRAWVTSLTTGRPIENATVSVYASNGLRLCEMSTGAGGEAKCVPGVEGYDPFAVVVSDGRGDMSFMALSENVSIDETPSGGVREPFVERGAASAFVWTERGIYRHEEQIMLHAILRDGNGNAPAPMPVSIVLHSPDGKPVERRSAVSDRFGAVKSEEFSVPGYRPSGKWKFRVEAGGREIGMREIKIEEFVPPQIRVAVEDLDKGEAKAGAVSFCVRAEHFFGGAVKDMAAGAVVTFKDAPFAPEGWDGYVFGDPCCSLKPNISPLPSSMTDSNGRARFTASLDPKFGAPGAAVSVTVQGSVAEPGGRAAYARASRIVHAHSRYVGLKAPRSLRRRDGTERIEVAVVSPDGARIVAATNLWASLSRIEHAYNLKERRGGSFAWECERLSTPVEIPGDVKIGADGCGVVEVPVSLGGEFELLVRGAGAAACRATFRVVSPGEDDVCAEMSNPSALAMEADKDFYREGDRPVITVKSPFRGWAHIAVMREDVLYTRVLELTNATSSVELDPVDASWAPNVDVAVSVVQGAAAGGHLSCRAHGLLALPVRPRDSEIAVKVDAEAAILPNGGATLKARIDARGECATGEVAVVTVVDEAINTLTDEPVPDPRGFFATLRSGMDGMPLYDIFNRLLPIWSGRLGATGAKTGGDCEEGLMKRISPTATRRFRPLSVWRFDVPLAGGVGETEFMLPEFSGEVRVTAVAYGRRATGAAAVTRKVTPKLVLQADAPRFAAPTDSFFATVVLHNRSGADGEATYSVSAEGAVSAAAGASGRVSLKDGEMRVVEVPVAAGRIVGEGRIAFCAGGFGESHESSIDIPVRPAAAWEEKCEVAVLAPGESVVSSNVSGEGAVPEATRRTFAASASPVAELTSALEYLAEYPHGCLEQTTSRMFPLVSAGALLGRLPAGETSLVRELPKIVGAGVARVASMVRSNDFTMWPDAECPPWDREVSAYAAHFLVEADAAGYAVPGHALSRVKTMLRRRWALSSDTDIAAYACHTLALCGAPEKDRMLSLYDARNTLTLLARARLARGFVRIGDPRRARELVADAALAPNSVKEAAFSMLAILEMDPADRRLPALVKYLQDRRDRTRFHWGTTCDNAHALMALAAYHNARGIRFGAGDVSLSGAFGKVRLADGSRHSVTGGAEIVVCNSGEGDAYVTTRTLALPDPASLTNRSSVIAVARRILDVRGEPVDLSRICRGETLVCEIAVTAAVERTVSDLVVQDLLPSCFEPLRAADAAVLRLREKGETNWILRSDSRDDRVLAYSLPAKVGAKPLRFRHAVRVTGEGDFVLPGVTVEAMYAPEVRADTAPVRMRVGR